MERNNIFRGAGKQATYANAAYELLMTGDWVTNLDIVVKADKVEKEEVLKNGISKWPYIGELKKVIPLLRSAIEEEVRKKEKVRKDCIVIEGNNRRQRMRYVGEDKDPLREMRMAKAINDIRQYWYFCQDAAGLLPTSWLEHFLQGSSDLLEINRRRRKGEQMISADQNRELKNIDLLPRLYQAIRDQRALIICYKPFGEEERVINFCPHFLKEYNGRWFLMGYTEGCEPEMGFIMALDRIEGKFKYNPRMTWHPAPEGYYAGYLRDKVGVSQGKDRTAHDVTIRAYGLKMFKLTETKPIHHSQRCVKDYGEYADGCYGEFALHVELNNELIGRILQMGDSLEVMAPDEARDMIARRISRMHARYQPSTEN